MGIGASIKRILAVRRMTIKNLSEQSGIPINTLYSLTRRDSESTRSDYLNRIATVLGVSVDAIISTSTAQIITGRDALLTPNQERLIQCAIETGAVIIVDGQHDPTGKTSLCDDLRRRGAVVWEPWEVEEGVVEPDGMDGKNTVFLTVRLNRPLDYSK